MNLELITIITFVAGLALIVKGADWFTEAAVLISVHTGIPKVVIGATIVSLATTAPEMTVSLMAAYSGHVDVAVGNAVGSAIANTGLILGGCIVISAIQVHTRSFIQKGLILLAAAVLLVIVSRDGLVSSTEGFVLLGVVAVFVYYNYMIAKAARDIDGFVMDGKGMLQTVPWFLLGAGCVIIGSKLLVKSGVDIAHALGIPEIVIGLTIMAVGTSLPELVTALNATFKGHQDMAVGNILGANTLDIALILGLSAQVSNLTVLPQSIDFDFPVLIVLTVALIVFGVTKGRFERWEGGLMLIGYLGYVAALFVWYVP